MVVQRSLNFYNRNALAFFSSTINVDMLNFHDRFLSSISPGSIVLDAGCGSGHDAKAFLDRGYRVVAFDASSELAKMAADYTGLNVVVRSFSDIKERASYDGILACASLLHLSVSVVPTTLRNKRVGVDKV